MTKNVLISIEGLQFGQEASSDKIEVITPGGYYRKRDKHYIVYEEVSEDSDEVTKNMIRFDNDMVSLTKRGYVNVEMVFEKNKRNMTNYVTPYGSILVGIEASDITITESEDIICISIGYALDINYEHLADCRICVNIRSLTEETIKDLGLS